LEGQLSLNRFVMWTLPLVAPVELPPPPHPGLTKGELWPGLMGLSNSEPFYFHFRCNVGEETGGRDMSPLYATSHCAGWKDGRKANLLSTPAFPVVQDRVRSPVQPQGISNFAHSALAIWDATGVVSNEASADFYWQSRTCCDS
jgi:hypothetical protein